MRYSLLLVAAALSLAPALGAQPTPAGAGPTGTIVTANMTAGTASVVDAATGASLRTYPTGDGPHEVAISHDGRWAVVSVYGDRTSIGHSLLVLDITGAAEPRTIELGDVRRPHGMRFLPGDRRLVVTSEATQQIALVDFAKGTIDTTLSTGQAATHMVAVTADGARAFTTNITPGTVSVFDLAKRTPPRTITVGTRIEGIAATADGSQLWLGANDARSVIVVDPNAGTELGRIDGFGMPYRIGITPDARTAVVSDPGAERIHVVDVATRKIRTTIEVPPGEGGPASPQGVTMSRDGRWAFVTLKAAGQVAIVDVAAGKIVGRVTVGGGSDGVGFSPVVAKPGR
jgi:DNA-binding beta-propeller fold protein YncE